MPSPRPSKRRKISSDQQTPPLSGENVIQRSDFPASLVRSISPPRPSRDRFNVIGSSKGSPSEQTTLSRSAMDRRTIVPSPFRLSRIRDLDAEDNVDTLSIRDIICDPMIKEIWCFNYLFDPDWILSNLDPDTRAITNLILIHGSWQPESDNRRHIADACTRLDNLSHVTAYLPDRFGTHHSKMMILFRHDDTAEVVIHTANMIEQDWRNMTQGIWKTGPLPKGGGNSDRATSLGSGQRLKHDLIAYVGTYTEKSGRPKLLKLIQQLKEYDFGSVRGALVASVPSRLNVSTKGPEEVIWGWPSLRRVLRGIPAQNRAAGTDLTPNDPEIVIQISSIASLGQTSKWLEDTLFQALSEGSSVSSPHQLDSDVRYTERRRDWRPEAPRRFSIIYPTPTMIRDSLNGYVSGASIHMRLDSATAQKQLVYLHPYLHDWTPSSSPPMRHSDAGRSLAAPHIKTYIRYAHNPSTINGSPNFIDWALLTSANLSTQAWGSAGSGEAGVWVQSFEIGVLVWPSLFQSNTDQQNAKMVPVFKKDIPDAIAGEGEEDFTVVGLRIPYSLPLRKYEADEAPWCPTKKEGYVEPDRLGSVWGL